MVQFVKTVQKECPVGQANQRGHENVQDWKSAQVKTPKCDLDETPAMRESKSQTQFSEVRSQILVAHSLEINFEWN
jgi:hypothetical protein